MQSDSHERAIIEREAQASTMSDQSSNPMRDAIQSAITENPVILFMKGTPDQPACGFSARTVAVLQSLSTPFAAVDILPDPRIRQELSALSNWPTIPQLFIDGELVGGCDIVMEMYQSGVADLRSVEPQHCEVSHPLKMFQPGVGDLRAVEPQHFKCGLPPNMLQGGIADLREAEVHPLQFGQRLKMFQPGISDLSAVEVQIFEVSQRFDVFQPSVGDLSAVERQCFEVAEPL